MGTRPTGGLSARVGVQGSIKPGGCRFGAEERHNMAERWQVGTGVASANSRGGDAVWSRLGNRPQYDALSGQTSI